MRAVGSFVYCGLMAPAASATTVVYVGNAESNEIIVLQLDRRNGDLTVVEKVSIPGIEKPGGSTPMAVSPDRRRRADAVSPRAGARARSRDAETCFGLPAFLPWPPWRPASRGEGERRPRERG